MKLLLANACSLPEDTVLLGRGPEYESPDFLLLPLFYV